MVMIISAPLLISQLTTLSESIWSFYLPRMTSLELLLHPVRLRVVRALLGDRALTTRQLCEELPEVPLASLYRHVARLVGADLLTVVSERCVRGAVERTYELSVASANSAVDEELPRIGTEEHRRAFMAFIGD